MKPLIVNQNRINSRLVAISPFEMYRELVRSVTDGVRYAAAGTEYIPSQFGGLQGQYNVLSAGVVLKLVDFDLSQSQSTS